jgi:hypothetical protein
MEFGRYSREAAVAAGAALAGIIAVAALLRASRGYDDPSIFAYQGDDHQPEDLQGDQ